MSHAHSGGRKYLLYGGRNTGRQMQISPLRRMGFGTAWNFRKKSAFLSLRRSTTAWNPIVWTWVR